MAAVGALGIGLSIAFGGFLLLLLAEIYYVFFWNKYDILQSRVSRICSERGDFAREAALVGSFGGYAESSAETQFLAKLFPMGADSACNDKLYMHGILRSPSFLFTIDEESKEDMELDEEGSNDSALHFPSSKQKLTQFPYSIGLIQQPQLFRSVSTKSISQQNILKVPSDFSCHPPSSSTSPSRVPSESVSPSICSRASSPEHQAFSSSPEQVFSHSARNSPATYCVSNPVYEVDAKAFQSSPSSPSGRPQETETPFGTPVSSPSLLTPPGTPPLSPISASQDPCVFFKRNGGHHRSDRSSIYSPSSSSTNDCLVDSAALETLPRESPCFDGLPPISRFCRATARPGSNSSSNASSPCTPFTTAPSTPYFTSSNQCPFTNPH